MSAATIGAIVFACVFGGALLGMVLRAILPEHHLSSESKDTVKLGMGLLATMAALVLSLLIASAKSSYDTQNTELTQLAANVMLLDQVLTHYGPETKEARDTLRATVSRAVDKMWPPDGAAPAQLNPRAVAADSFYDKIQALSPQNERQRSFRAQALQIAADLGRTRWLLFEQGHGSIPLPFLVMLTFWVAIIFMSFGLFAPPNATVVATLLLCALSVSAAIFLVLELDRPFSGLIHVSSAPMREARARDSR